MSRAWLATVSLGSWGGEALALRDQIALAHLHSIQAGRAPHYPSSWLWKKKNHWSTKQWAQMQLLWWGPTCSLTFLGCELHSSRLWFQRGHCPLTCPGPPAGVGHLWCSIEPLFLSWLPMLLSLPRTLFPDVFFPASWLPIISSKRHWKPSITPHQLGGDTSLCSHCPGTTVCSQRGCHQDPQGSTLATIF